jgi:hypothetical protein
MQKHPGTSKRGDNLYFRFKMKSVTADMSDDDLLRLSDGNGRMLTSLRIEREHQRDPLLAAFARESDKYFALHETMRSAYARGSDEEVQRLAVETEKTYWRMSAALRAIERRDCAAGNRWH